MSLVFCRGCAKEISSLAVACPQCGAPQATQQSYASGPAITTGNPYVEALKNYAEFKGRATRREYWMFVLINLGICIVMGVLDAMLNTKGVLYNLYSLAMFLPSIAAGARRMHDTDRSGWWLLLPIVNLVFLVQDSQPGPNRFGPNRKGNN
ncbi:MULTISPECIES: DUF805 domain-containing protein [Pseudomonas]|jgi:uncharacterized membrane protein YhaH (DUF805 family)|uniref:DUF805 domain-containing protein n=1 Tax=Pseudomonas TaxID=286 RepID=UPI000CD4BDEC|nr:MULTISPECIES: DUF805 domain-containing protein [unclassified Pseudomonas]MBK5343969.1 DUF805 domain-containing protein [Pseudomonas sp. TH49]MCU1771335.1 DUF805 domain-containing protein [Pseudomonas sp. 13B_3.2_Bac1]RBC00852.1 DUF805 domain-containing protein [Pseudomonas sp. MWU12-2115]RBL68593.1 DUF805 domain-containing protein [Pseudomonas sp. MWU13-2625]